MSIGLWTADHVAVSKEFLDGPDVAAIFEQVGREGVAKRAGRGPLGDARPADRVLDDALEDGLVEVMPVPLPGDAVTVHACRWEHPLPDPLAPRVRILARAVAALDPAGAGLEVALVLFADLLEVAGQVCLDHEHVPVEEQERAQRLILCGGGHVTFDLRRAGFMDGRDRAAPAAAGRHHVQDGRAHGIAPVSVRGTQHR